jgi:hypothetical protein
MTVLLIKKGSLKKPNCPDGRQNRVFLLPTGFSLLYPSVAKNNNF